MTRRLEHLRPYCFTIEDCVEQTVHRSLALSGQVFAMIRCCCGPAEESAAQLRQGTSFFATGACMEKKSDTSQIRTLSLLLCVEHQQTPCPAHIARTLHLISDPPLTVPPPCSVSFLRSVFVLVFVSLVTSGWTAAALQPLKRAAPSTFRIIFPSFPWTSSAH